MRYNMTNVDVVVLWMKKGDWLSTNTTMNISVDNDSIMFCKRNTETTLCTHRRRLLLLLRGFRSSRCALIVVILKGKSKRWEEMLPLLIGFWGWIKAFDSIDKDIIFMSIQIIECPLWILNINMTFHDEMMKTVVFHGIISQIFITTSCSEQGCVFDPTYLEASLASNALWTIQIWHHS